MKKTTWCKPRHKVIWKLFYPPVWLLTWLKYKPKLERFREAKKGQFLVLMNHQTPYDQFFVSLSFASPVYFVATEDIFSLGFLSKLLSYLVAPIPIKKFSTDIKAVKNCLQVAKEGGTICIAPEGNTTYSGYTGYMKPTIVSLARKFKLPIAIYKIEGGYGKHPRWSSVIRKGPIHGGVSEVISPDEYLKWSDEEFLENIQTKLYVNECVSDNLYHHRKLSEYLERAIYVCPDCGLSQFESHDAEMSCNKCGKTIIYKSDKSIEGKGFVFPFKYVSEWYDYQSEYVNSLLPSDYLEAPVYKDKADVYEVIVYKKKELLCKAAELSLYGNRVEIDSEGSKTILNFDDFQGCAVLGRNKLSISAKGDVYQIKGSERFNALKYMNFYYRYKNVSRGEENDKFLGL